MNKHHTFKNWEEYTYYLLLHLRAEDSVSFRSDFLQLHPADQAAVFKQMNREKREKVYNVLTSAEFAEIFQELELQEQKTVFTELEEDKVIAIVEELPADEITDYLGEIPVPVARYWLDHMDEEKADSIQQLLAYKEETAGSMMTTELIKVKENDLVSEAMHLLHLTGDDYETIYYLYVVSEKNVLAGVVSLRELIMAAPSQKMKTIMKQRIISVQADAAKQKLLQLFQDYDLIALPVTDARGTLLGIITIDDMLEEMGKDTDKNRIDRFNGKETYDAVFPLQQRLSWILLLLVLGFAAVFAASRFDTLLAEAAVLALLSPFIRDAAVNKELLSSALVRRTFSQQSSQANRKLLTQKLLSGGYLGIALGTVAGMTTFLFQQEPAVSLIIAGGLAIAVILSVLGGALLPLAVAKMNIHPAFSSGSVITTLNDMINIIIYFLTAAALLYILKL